MFGRFSNLSIQAKLSGIVMVICGSLVIGVTSLFVIDKVYSFRQSMVETHTILVETLAKNSTAALIFDDAISAGDTLSALKAVPYVVSATVYTRDGNAFASYRRDGDEAHPLVTVSSEIITQISSGSQKNAVHLFKRGHLELATPVSLDGKRLGYIAIRADLKRLNTRLISSIIVVIALIIVIGIVAQLLSVKLHRSFAKPLFELMDTMEAVKKESRYSYRLEKLNNDEFGVLTEGFNAMLAEIEKRDEMLGKHGVHLEALVSQRTQELLVSNQQLQVEIEERKQVQDKLARAQRMEAIGTLAAGVAHDLNNILSGVVSYPELLLMRLPEGHEMYEALVTIQTSGKKAAAIVQDLLTLARRGGISMEVVDFGRVIEDYLASPECAKMLELHPHVRVKQKFSHDVLLMKGSPVHLSKTIMNLITNAAEAMGDKGTIVLEMENCYLDRPVHGYSKVVEGNYILLSVKDSGHGINADDLKFIFEPFYTKKKLGISGTGLGMAVVWGTVDDHKGYIDVNTVPGEGTTFYLYFPATKEQYVAKETENMLQYQGKGESILVVDDVAEQRIIAKHILVELGYNVKTVPSGEEALQHLQHQAYDLLILDMIMDPGMDGIETYRNVLEIYPGQKALIASGYSELSRVKQAHELGITLYLRKPYTVAGLAKVVREELGRE